MSREKHLAELAETAEVLVQGWTTKAMIGRTVQERRHDGLLTQLRHQVSEAGGVTDGNANGAAVIAKMPGSEQALTLLVEVDRELGHLVCALGATRPSQDPDRNIAWVLRTVADHDDEAVQYVTDSVKRLRHKIELALDWTDPPRRLRAECPMCARVDVLIVLMGDYGPETAKCMSCATEWRGEASLGVLASQINASSATAEAPSTETGDET